MAKLFGFKIDGNQNKSPSVISPVPETNQDGVDNYIDSLLDFSFLSGVAKTWNASSRVIVRENDFPDNEKTSDHRPVELILSGG